MIVPADMVALSNKLVSFRVYLPKISEKQIIIVTISNVSKQQVKNNSNIEPILLRFPVKYIDSNLDSIEYTISCYEPFTFELKNVRTINMELTVTDIGTAMMHSLSTLEQLVVNIRGHTIYINSTESSY